MLCEPVNASWCEISLSVIAKNLQLALGLLPSNAQFCAVLKADAYGHGIAQIVQIIKDQGVKYVGITSNAEARTVRNAGFSDTLIRLRSATRPEIEGALPEQVQEQVSSLYAAQVFHEIISSGIKIPGLHLALNAGGMSRDGLELANSDGQQTCLDVLGLIGRHITGICSHFPSNTPQDLTLNNQRFQDDVSWVFAHSTLTRETTLVHAGSSLTLVSDKAITTDLYRCGAIMYGILKPELGFQPSMQLKAHITNIATYPLGSTIGYDRVTSLSDDRKLANISLGYSNGLGRGFFGRSAVLIGGHQAPILGKISMNTIIADITGLAKVAVGDEVVVFGQQEKEYINVATMERQAGTIMADIFTDWGHRNPRVYLE